MNDHPMFVRIIKRCLSIEGKAVQGYRILSNRPERIAEDVEAAERAIDRLLTDVPWIPKSG